MSRSPRLNRRSFLSRVTGAAGAAAGAFAAVYGSAALSQQSDGDISDPTRYYRNPNSDHDRERIQHGGGDDEGHAGQITRFTDQDGRDAPGRGGAHNPGFTGYSDTDGHDASGWGRATDRDAADQVGRGRHPVTDHDSSDAMGHGRGSGPVTGLTDRDPNDSAGRGHGPGGPPRTGVTDRDSRDAANYGRGHGLTHVTDRDASDPANYGGGPRQVPPDVSEPYNGRSRPYVPGASDQDATDAAGGGRGSAIERVTPRPSGVSDHDPNDPAGSGRGSSGVGSATERATPRVSGLSDHDPNDPAGNGRGSGGGGPR